MWDTLFDESMLDKGVIILCPEKDLADELFELLREHGIRWNNSMSLNPGHTFWDEARDATCYRVSINRRLTYGSSYWYEGSNYNAYIRCRFVGKDALEISDSEFETIILRGGGK